MKATMLFLLTCCLALTACHNESYKEGEGPYSNMLADFAEVDINGKLQAVSFVTDEGDRYDLEPYVSASWIQKADTTYRAIIYFNPLGSSRAEVVQMGYITTLKPHPVADFKKLPQDPLGIESAWLTTSGKYINLGLLLRNGYTNDDEGTHALAVACDEVRVNADHTRTAYYRLLHDQGDAPEYYTNRRYVSILLPEDRPDSVRLTVNTYEGTILAKFKL